MQYCCASATEFESVMEPHPLACPPATSLPVAGAEPNTQVVLEYEQVCDTVTVGVM
jgi:hypothetical protein